MGSLARALVRWKAARELMLIAVLVSLLAMTTCTSRTQIATEPDGSSPIRNASDAPMLAPPSTGTVTPPSAGQPARVSAETPASVGQPAGTTYPTPASGARPATLAAATPASASLPRASAVVVPSLTAVAALESDTPTPHISRETTPEATVIILTAPISPTGAHTPPSLTATTFPEVQTTPASTPSLITPTAVLTETAGVTPSAASPLTRTLQTETPTPTATATAGSTQPTTSSSTPEPPPSVIPTAGGAFPDLPAGLQLVLLGILCITGGLGLQVLYKRLR